MAGNWSRRGFVGTLITGAASLLNSSRLFGAGVSNTSAAATVTGFGQSGNPYQELGIPTVINAMGTMTMLGGSLIRPEVELVMSQAAKHFVGIPALEVAAGKRLAEMLKLPYLQPPGPKVPNSCALPATHLGTSSLLMQVLAVLRG